MSDWDVIIVGGGASGLFCAAQAGLRGRRVLVVDRSNKVGKKILMSGGGRCNFTNLDVRPDHYLSHNPHFCKSALKRFTQWDFLALVQKYRIPYHERLHGQLFCNESASDILDLLLTECAEGGVEIRTRCAIDGVGECVAEGEYRYELKTSGEVLRCHSLVVATGGLSIPTLGGSGLGYEIARQFGLSVLPVRAGLVPFTFTDALKGVCERLSGLAVPVTMGVGDVSFSENLLFTHRGMSGPVVLQVSNYWLPGQNVVIDLLPGMDVAELLRTAKQAQPRQLLRTVFSQYLARSLVTELQRLYWAEVAETALAEIPDQLLDTLGGVINRWSVKPSGTEGYRTAEVTLGGVDTNELSSKTLESKKHPGLFFIGEVLDVTGHLGGYNFQWAWASGFAAGQFV